MGLHALRSIYQRLSLRTRITVSFVLLMAGAMGFIALVELVDYDQVRASVISAEQDQEVSRLQEALRDGQLPALPPGSHLYGEHDVPAVLRQYGRGYHGEPAPNEWHLRVFDAQGKRYYLLQEGEYFAYLDLLINVFAALVILTCVLCAFWIGRLTSAHVIAPITRLSDAVQNAAKPFPYQQARDEIGVLARAFAQHSDELEQFLHREQCFAGDASHELRTPLAIIAGAAETLLHQLPAGSHLLPSADRILRTTQEMERQLACLLLLSRSPASLSMGPVPLRAITEDCIARCGPWLAGKPVMLHLDAPGEVTAVSHAELVRCVVWNLLRNACQYTDQGEVRVTLREGELAIADTGPGLPSSIDPLQFSRFLPSARQDGEGLGLSIVQRVVEHLGWQMTVATSDQGCRFLLRMNAPLHG
ncbi:sensor histidine kinase [Stenotrophomonas maltophilia]|uniref:sensor histidine kinase n=1 Tax=Stenotrophomonas maltophilia TaxID=40324 RepID=UPI0039F6E449